MYGLVIDVESLSSAIVDKKHQRGASIDHLLWMVSIVKWKICWVED